MTRVDFKLGHVPPGSVAESAPLPNLFTSTAIRHLMREYPQNTADASQLMRGGAMAEMKVRFGTVDRAALAPYGVETAIRHAEACEEASVGKWDGGDRLRFFAIEDRSGGLEGNVTATSNDLASAIGKYLFAVGTGVSGKRGRSNGRYGVGSMTGALASRLRLMYVYSRRMDGTSNASARLSLPRHELDDQTYSSESRLGVLDENGNWLGILSGEEADALAAVFGFDTSPDYAGLSVAIIEPLDGVNFDTAVEAVLVEQFYQIASKIVSVEVVDEDEGRSILINSETVRPFFDTDEYQALKARLRRRGRPFAFDPLDRTKQGLDFIATVGQIEVHDIESFDEAALPPSLKTDFLSGKAVAVRVPTTATRTDGTFVTGFVTHYLMKLADGQNGQSILVRDAIVNVRKAVGYIALSVSREDEIAAVLGDCEDPQHANYREPNAHERGWADVSEAVCLFLSGTDMFRRALADASAKSDRTSLAHIFPMPGQDIKGKPEGGPEGDDSEGEIVVPAISNVDILDFKEDRKAQTVTATLTSAAKRKVAEGEAVNLLVEIDYWLSKKGVGTFADGKGTVQVIDPEATVSQSGNGSRVEAYGISEDFTIIIRDVDFRRDLQVDQSIINDTEFEEAA